MAITFGYRLSSGIVEYASSVGSRLAPSGNSNHKSAAYMAEVTDPTAPDGNDLSPTKIWTGTVMRDATAPEAASGRSLLATDVTTAESFQAQESAADDPVLRRILKAQTKRLMQEIRKASGGPFDTNNKVLADIQSSIRSES